MRRANIDVKTLHNYFARDAYLFFFVVMAYNKKNFLKRAAFILQVYQSVKEHDIPDTYILKYVFPKYGIELSYRTWMNMKNIKQTELPTPQHQLQRA